MYSGRGAGRATPEGRGDGEGLLTVSGSWPSPGQGLFWAMLPELQVRSDRRDGLSWSFRGRVGLGHLAAASQGSALPSILRGSALEGSVYSSVGGRDPGPGKKSWQRCLRPLSQWPQLLPTPFHFHFSPPSPVLMACRSRANHTGSFHKTTDFNGK